MSKKQFNQSIPNGWETYTTGFKVAGIHHKRSEVSNALVNNESPTVTLTAMAMNNYDPNAVMVIIPKTFKLWTFSFTVKNHIGYLPTDLSMILAEHGIVGKVKARLRSVYYNADGNISSVIIDIVGPSELYSDELKRDLDECEM